MVLLLEYPSLIQRKLQEPSMPRLNMSVTQESMHTFRQNLGTSGDRAQASRVAALMHNAVLMRLDRSQCYGQPQLHSS